MLKKEAKMALKYVKIMNPKHKIVIWRALIDNDFPWISAPCDMRRPNAAKKSFKKSLLFSFLEMVAKYAERVICPEINTSQTFPLTIEMIELSLPDCSTLLT